MERQCTALFRHESCQLTLSYAIPCSLIRQDRQYNYRCVKIPFSQAPSAMLIRINR